MKTVNKLICIMMLLVVVMPATSQSLHDYIRSRAGNSDSLIINAVSPALSLIRQQYRLKRQNDYYGRRGKPYYGETYSLGVKISGSTLLQRDVLFPWENDTDYQRVNADGKYEPALFISQQRFVKDSVWRNVEFDFQNFTKPWSTDYLLFDSQDRISDFGLTTDMTEGQKKGYLIWVYSTSQSQDSAMQVNFRQMPLSLKERSDSLVVNVFPEGISNVLGGIFVVPKVMRAGDIRIELAGVAVTKGKNNWVLELFAIKDDIEATGHKNKANKPIKKKKSKEKNELGKDQSVDDSEPTPIK